MKKTLIGLASFAGVLCVSADPISPAGTAAGNVAAIQAAIDVAAVANPTGTVTLGNGLFEIDAQLVVTGGVTLVGQGWDNTIIKQVATTSNADTRVVEIGGGATVGYLTITGGSVNKPGGWSMGGGAFVSNGTITWCCITNNMSGSTPSANNYGGGVFFGDGKGQIDHSIVADNHVIGTQTSYGGGIAIRRPTGAVTIDTCLVLGNSISTTTSPGRGGGIGLEHGTTPVVTVRNTTIAGNESGTDKVAGDGGAVYTTSNASGKFAMLNCIIADNTTVGTNITVNLNSAGGVDYCLFDISDDKIGEHSKVGNPAFVDATNGDYHLLGSSPAIGAGVRYEGLENDLDNVVFAEIPSMGCYESGDLAATPVFDPVSGTVFYPSTNVTLSCETADATIYYTTDGSIPTESSTAYSGPIEISATTTFKARAYKSGLGASGVVSATYTFKRPTPPPSSFKKSVEITLSTNLAATAVTTGIPALVKLSESTIADFDYDDFSLAKGGDMMFVDASGTVLPHEVDTWDTAGESLVWVKLPSTAENTKIILYYGNGAVSPEESTDVWANYVGVWHLNEANGNALDATGHGLTAVPSGDNAATDSTGAVCRVGFGRHMASAQGNKSYLAVANNDQLDCGDTFTFSGWFKATGTFGNYSMRYVSRKNGYSDGNGWEAEASYAAADVSAVTVSARGASTGNHTATVPDIRANWLHLAIVYSGKNITFYVNGVPQPATLTAAASDNDLALAFGNNPKGSESNWVGYMDELRLVADAVSANYAVAEYAAMNVGETDIFTYGDAKSTKARSGVIIIVE